MKLRISLVALALALVSGGSLFAVSSVGDAVNEATTWDPQEESGVMTWEFPIGKAATNAGPVVDAGPSVTIEEGDAVWLDFSGSTPSSRFISYKVDPGDGSEVETTYVDSSGAFPWFHQYAEVGIYTVTLIGTDRSAGGNPIVTTDTTVVTVENVPPSVIFITPLYAAPGSLDFRAYVKDPGGLDAMTIGWDFGDGTTSSGGLGMSHAYTEPGVYDVTVTATDRNGGEGSNTFQVTVSDTPASDSSGQTSVGRRFWLAFDANFSGHSPYKRFFITGEDGTTGVVAIPGLEFVHPFSIGGDEVVTVDVPQETRGALVFTGAGGEYLEDIDGAIAPIAIYIDADHDITVYGINYEEYTTDAYLGLPVTATGMRYRLIDHEDDSVGGIVSVVATQDDTEVNVEPATEVGVDPFTITLSLGEVFEWEADPGRSLTGTVIESNKPVSVFAGNPSGYVPSDVEHRNHLIEQMLPTTTWGKAFVTYPLFGRTQDTFRIVADLDGTQITINEGSDTFTHNLSAGEYWEFLSGEPMMITSNMPIEIAQYSNGSDFDNTDTDPFMVLILPYEQGFTDSLFVSPDGFTNYVNITAPTTSVEDVLLDGGPIASDQWQSIPGSGYSGVSVPIEAGNHRISSPVPLQTIVYGFVKWDAYGYPGGQRTVYLEDANSLIVDPAEVEAVAGNEICTTATLASSDGRGIPATRLDVTLTGVVQQSIPMVTRADGTVPICATSTMDGTTTVTVTHGDLTGQAMLKWVPAPTFAVSYIANSVDASGVVVDDRAYHAQDMAEVLGADELSLAGSSFVSWNTVPDGSGVSYVPGDSVVVTGDVTLYAQWEANVVTHVVKFMDGQGNLLASVVVDDGGSATAPADPIRNGFVFTGWDKGYDDVTSDVTVTAQWTAVKQPTVSPSVGPTVVPSTKPTVLPSVGPTVVLSVEPTIQPSTGPTVVPSTKPTVSPSVGPTLVPSVGPTVVPSVEPTVVPSVEPTIPPSVGPTLVPSTGPTVPPSTKPTVSPSMGPIVLPSVGPTVQLSVEPTVVPSVEPTTIQPSVEPAVQPPVEPAMPTVQTPTQPSIQPQTGGTAQNDGFPLILASMAIVVGLLIYRLRRTIS